MSKRGNHVVEWPEVDGAESVVIWSGEHGAFWGPNSGGYFTSVDSAGLYTLDEARATTGHCGPEKRIEIRPAPDDHKELLRARITTLEEKLDRAQEEISTLQASLREGEELLAETRRELQEERGRGAVVRGLLAEARDLLRRWEREEDCECPPEGHVCGKPYLDRLLEAMDSEIADPFPAATALLELAEAAGGVVRNGGWESPDPGALRDLETKYDRWREASR